MKTNWAPGDQLTAKDLNDIAGAANSAAGKYTKPPAGIPIADLKKADLDAAYGRVWKASTAYAAGDLVLLPAPVNGTGTRNTSGTSRGAFDATEQSAWTATGGGGATVAFADNGDGTFTLTSDSDDLLTDNGNGTFTLTI